MKEKSIVAIVACKTYEKDEVLNAVARGLSLLGGSESIFPKATKILIKPNMLSGDSTDRGVTTHPSVFFAVGKILKQAGFKLYFGDSPAFGKSLSVAIKSGIKEEADNLNIELADFEHGKEVPSKLSGENRIFYIAKGVFDADLIINIPKMKTHSLTIMTGAIKNIFGIIPGIRKAGLHARLKDPEPFMRMLVDLNLTVNPTLNIMDAVYGMQGNGPRNGELVNTGCLLFSCDAAAIDATACRIMGVDPVTVYFLKYAEKMGLGNIREEKILIKGKSLKECISIPYKIPILNRGFLSNFTLFKFLRKYFIHHPVIDRQLCTKCLQCIKICPLKHKAIRKRNGGLLYYDYKRCIRCYCCQEICPEGAIRVKVPLLGTIFKYFGSQFWGRY